MALTGRTEFSQSTSLQQYEVGAAETFGLAVEQATYDNPISRIITNTQVVNAEQNAEDNNRPKITKAQAEQKAMERGVQIQNLPDEISEDAFEILAERQYQRKRLATTLMQSNSPTAEIAGGLVGGLADPINIASAFIPIPGINGLTSQLAKSGTNIFTRSLVRAQIGAMEGAFGGALIEAGINVPLAGRVGDDYGVSNVVMNILAGAVGGSILHSGFGAIGDVLKEAPMGTAKVDKRIAAMPVEAKGDLVNTVMAQAMDDRPINTSFLIWSE